LLLHSLSPLVPQTVKVQWNENEHENENSDHVHSWEYAKDDGNLVVEHAQGSDLSAGLGGTKELIHVEDCPYAVSTVVENGDVSRAIFEF
jgi:hypothetical protein